METTSSGATPSPDDLWAGLLEVLNVCPVVHCNPADCPLYLLREMDFDRRLQWFNALNRSDLEYLAAYHYVCMQLRAGESQTGCNPQVSG